jgi:hypothetical protein
MGIENLLFIRWQKIGHYLKSKSKKAKGKSLGGAKHVFFEFFFKKKFGY